MKAGALGKEMEGAMVAPLVTAKLVAVSGPVAAVPVTVKPPSATDRLCHSEAVRDLY